MSEKKEPYRADMVEVVLTIIIGSALTYFFFSPIKEGVSGFLKTLLPTG